MSKSLPKFDSPPVIEVVIGIQFEPLPGWSAAHAGLYWEDQLGAEWTTAKQAPPLNDQYERFGKEREWRAQELRVLKGVEPSRIQLVQERDEHMIQVQASRFLCNWRKRDGSYPSFGRLLPEFENRLEGFRAFLDSSTLGDLSPNQWEITYVNHLLKGDLWNSASDWMTIFPGLYAPGMDLDGQLLESLGGQWEFVLGRDRGRLHVTLQYGRLATTGPELLVLQLTARGSVDEERSWSYRSGLELGHESIVKTFTAMTSEAAHTHWRRTI